MVASIAANIGDDPKRGVLGNFVMMVRPGWSANDFLYLMMSETLECRLATILRFDREEDKKDPNSIAKTMAKWAKSMAHAIPGYNNWAEVDKYIRACLLQKGENPDDKISYEVGSEGDFLKLLSGSELTAYLIVDPADREKIYQYKIRDHKDLYLSLAKDRLKVLETYRSRNKNETNVKNKRLFRKIYYSYKLMDALLSQLGYYGGSLEFYLDMTDDFEYWMYSLSMKTRRPDRQYYYHAPKPMIPYITTKHSPLPWNNQFSFSYGFDEFGIGEMPRFVVNSVERRLIEVVRNEQRLQKLCEFLEWDRDEFLLNEEVKRFYGPGDSYPGLFPDWNSQFVQNNMILADLKFKTLNTDNILRRIITIKKEIKTYFAEILQLPWSDEPMDDKHNLFLHLSADQKEQLGLRGAALLGSWEQIIRDPRLRDKDLTDYNVLKSANQMPNVVGRGANILLEPEGAAEAFGKKLARLSDDDFQALYAPQRAWLSRTVTREEVIKNATDKTKIWRDSAISNKKPIYTGPSGHTIGYMSLYISSLEKMTASEQAAQLKIGPDLEYARLVLLAGLIGYNLHHSYDEVMTAAEGLTFRGKSLEYTDRVGYRDVLEMKEGIGAKVAERLLKEIKAIADKTIREYKDAQNDDPTPEDPLPTVKAWYKAMTGNDYN